MGFVKLSDVRYWIKYGFNLSKQIDKMWRNNHQIRSNTIGIEIVEQSYQRYVIMINPTQ